MLLLGFAATSNLLAPNDGVKAIYYGTAFSYIRCPQIPVSWVLRAAPGDADALSAGALFEISILAKDPVSPSPMKASAFCARFMVSAASTLIVRPGCRCKVLSYLLFTSICSQCKPGLPFSILMKCSALGINWKP